MEAGNYTPLHVNTPTAKNAHYAKVASSNRSDDGIELRPKAQSGEDLNRDNSFCSERHADSIQPWSPFWLKKPVLGLFCAWFVAWTIILPILLWYSRRHNGLLETLSDLGNFWRFGPTAICTLIVLVWDRVELQTLRYQPWMAIHTEGSANPNDYTLDYSSMVVPSILIQSIKRKHYVVFLVCVVSVLLKVQTVLSSALFVLSDVAETRPADIRVLDFFATNSTSNSSTVAYFNSIANDQFDMERPFGVSEEFVYQTFAVGSESSQHRGTTDKPLTATVDAVFSEIQCFPLKSYKNSRQYLGTKLLGGANNTVSDSYRFTLSLEFDNCHQPIEVNQTLAWQDTGGKADSQVWDSYLDTNGSLVWTYETFSSRIPKKNPRQCSALPQKHTQFIQLAAHYTSSSQNMSVPELDMCGAVICAPLAWISKVQITDNGISPDIILLPDQNSTVIDHNPWTMLESSIPDDRGRWRGSNWWSPAGATEAWHIYNNLTYDSKNISFANAGALLQPISELFNALSPWIAQENLRVAAGSQSRGLQREVIPKAIVNQATAISMTVIFAISAFLTLWFLLKPKEQTAVWYRDPATFLGSMAFFNSSFGKAISESISESVPIPGEDRKASWGNGNYSPLIFRAWFRSLLTIYLLIIIIGLVVSLRQSQLSDGLAVVPEMSGIFIWWRIIPAFAMLLISLYVTFSALSIREMAAIIALSSRPCNAKEIDKSLLDMIGLKALFYAFKLRVHKAALLQALSIICAFLPALSTLLFSLQTIPGILKAVPAEQKSWFGSKPYVENNTEYDARFSKIQTNINNMYFAPNLSNIAYPQLTFGDVLFPRLEIDLADGDWSPGKEAKVTTPAAKLVPDCFQIPTADLKTNLTKSTKGYSTMTYLSPLTLTLACPNGTLVNYDDDFAYGEKRIQKGEGYFAYPFMLDSKASPLSPNTSHVCGAEFNKDDIRKMSWRVIGYLWGKVSSSATEFEHLSAYVCNYTWGEVQMEVKLAQRGEEVIFDYQNPPRQLQSVEKNWDPPFPVMEVGYFDTSKFEFPHNFNNPDPRASALNSAFSNLVPPFGSLDIGAFNDSSQDAKILERVHWNYGLFAAQNAHELQRLDLNETSDVSPFQHTDLPLATVAVTDTQQKRLVQSLPITCTIVTILGLVFAVNVWGLASTALKYYLGDRGWLLDLQLKGIAPNRFGSVALLDSLLSGSNCCRQIPQDAHLLAPVELYKHLTGVEYRIGWFWSRQFADRQYALGSLHDDTYEFLGPK